MLFSDVVRQILLKNIDIHSVSLLNLIYIIVFDIETVQENTKLTI